MIAIRICVLVACMALVGCDRYRPLYGTTPTGLNVATELASVNVVEQRTRAGQLVRNNIIGGTQPDGSSKYELRLKPTETTTEVSSQTGTTLHRKRYGLSVAFELRDLTNGTVIKSGTSFSNVSYDTVREPIADLQAANNAIDRAAQEVGQDLRLRLAAIVSSRHSS